MANKQVILIMTHRYEILPITQIPRETKLVAPNLPPEVAHLEDHALDIMIDFSQIQPITIQSKDSIAIAENEMKNRDAHLLIVTDSQKNIVGIVGAEDLLGEKPIKIMQESRIPRNEIPIKMVMRKQKDVIAFDIDELQHAKVGNIICTLREHSRHYALVVEINKDKHNKQHIMIRGYFSAALMSKQLHMNVMDYITQAQSLAELQQRHK